MAPVSLLHVVGVAIGAGALYRCHRLINANDERPMEFLIWLSVGAGLWLVVGVDLIVPSTVLAPVGVWFRTVGIQSVEMGLIAGILTLALFSLYLYTLLESYRRRLVVTQQELALVRDEVSTQGNSADRSHSHED